MQNPTQSSLKPLSPCFQAAFPCKGRLKFRFQTASNATTRNAKADSLYTPKGNRISEFDGTRYIYDDLGNTKLRELPDGETQLYTYDTENQLSTATVYKKNGSIEKWRYAYDPFGRRLSKERIDKGSLKSTNPKCTVFVWDGTRMVQEYNYKGVYTYLYTDQDSYEPLAHVFHNGKDGKLYLSYYHTDQIGLPREQTDQFGNLLWVGEYDAWGSLKTENRVYPNAHQPFRLQNQYCDEETGLHYNLMRYYDPNSGRFVNQDPIGLLGGEHLYAFAPNAMGWVDVLGLTTIWKNSWMSAYPGASLNNHQVHHIIPKNPQTDNLAKSLCSKYDKNEISNLIALPKCANTASQSGNGYGKTLHNGGHVGYNNAVNRALKIAAKIKIPGVSGCNKLRIIQNILRSQLERGGVSLYQGSNKSAQQSWQRVIINGLKQRK